MTDAVPARREDVPAAIGRYHIVDLLQRGEGATIYLATVADNPDREVVVKVTPYDAVDAPLLVHRHIARVIERGHEGTLSYTAMEHVRGRALRAVIADPAGLDVDARVDLVAQIAVGLHFAHEHGVVHGDVTPDHVLVRDDGVVKILNFRSPPPAPNVDVAWAPSHRSPYIAPEQLTGRGAVDGRSDVYAVGLILHELLTGRLPPQPASAAESRGAADVSLLRATPKVADVLRRALATESARRFSSAQEFAFALWSLGAELPVDDEESKAEAVAELGAPLETMAGAQPLVMPPDNLPLVAPPSVAVEQPATRRDLWVYAIAGATAVAAGALLAVSC